MEVRQANIPVRFRALRRKARITQETLGTIIGVCRQTVNEIENRRVVPHYSTVERFCHLEAKHQQEICTQQALLTAFWRR